MQGVIGGNSTNAKNSSTTPTVVDDATAVSVAGATNKGMVHDIVSWDAMSADGAANSSSFSHPAVATPPPPTQINKLQLSASTIRKDKRRSSSRFNISSNRELFKLPSIRGDFDKILLI